MENATYNPANIPYYTRFNGTANLSTSMGAQVVAAKGHYY